MQSALLCVIFIVVCWVNITARTPRKKDQGIALLRVFHRMQADSTNVERLLLFSKPLIQWCPKGS